MRTTCVVVCSWSRVRVPPSPSSVVHDGGSYLRQRVACFDVDRSEPRNNEIHLRDPDFWSCPRVTRRATAADCRSKLPKRRRRRGVSFIELSGVPLEESALLWNDGDRCAFLERGKADQQGPMGAESEGPSGATG